MRLLGSKGNCKSRIVALILMLLAFNNSQSCSSETSNLSASSIKIQHPYRKHQLLDQDDCVSDFNVTENDMKVITAKETPWSGTISNENFDAIRQNMIIKNDTTWRKVWKTLHGGKEIPNINFDRNFIYVDHWDAEDINMASLCFMIDNVGQLYIPYSSTLASCCSSNQRQFNLYKVNRSGINFQKEVEIPEFS